MNLEESDKFIKEREARNGKRRMVLISIVFCAVLIAFLFIIILFLYYQDAQTLKVFVDGTKQSFSSNLFKEIDGQEYVNAREITKMLDCTYTKGEYGKYTEDNDSCYISSNHEVVSMKADSSSMTKYILNEDTNSTSTALSKEKLEAEQNVYGTQLTVKSANETEEVFNLKNPVKLVDGNLYIPFDLLPEVFNVNINTKEKNRVRIYTLATLYQQAKNVAGKLGYTTITGEYENVRALVYGLIVVGQDDKYGVINTSGEEVISLKYNEVEFVQNVKEFFVYANNTIGLLGSDGATIIKPTEYDDISVLSAEKQLYLVQKNNKYGVLNRKGEVVVHAEYDQIGLVDKSGKSTEDELISSLENPVVLFDTCIPVKQGTKYGLYDIDGTELAKTVYDGLGYKVDTKNNSSSSSSSNSSTTTVGENSVLLLPESTGIKGIVINQNGGYGIYDVEAKRIIVPTVCSKIYSVTKNGITNYYMEFSGNQLDVAEYMVANNLVSVKANSNKADKNSIVDNTVDTTNTTDTNVTTDTSTQPVEEQSTQETTEGQMQEQETPVEQQPEN